jgi:hypothetical protein
MNNVKAALIWISNILQKNHVQFQIAGGLAVRAYGSNRKLMDIDIDISENDFEQIKHDVQKFITFGPGQFKNENWDLYLITLNYNGQEIDLGGAYQTKIYDKKNKRWVKIITDFSKVNYLDIAGLKLPVINREDLIAYKKILAREVDLQDVAYLEKSK